MACTSVYGPFTDRLSGEKRGWCSPRLSNTRNGVLVVARFESLPRHACRRPWSSSWCRCRSWCSSTPSSSWCSCSCPSTPSSPCPCSSSWCPSSWSFWCPVVLVVLVVPVVAPGAGRRARRPGARARGRPRGRRRRRVADLVELVPRPRGAGRRARRRPRRPPRRRARARCCPGAGRRARPCPCPVVPAVPMAVLVPAVLVPLALVPRPRGRPRGAGAGRRARRPPRRPCSCLPLWSSWCRWRGACSVTHYPRPNWVPLTLVIQLEPTWTDCTLPGVIPRSPNAPTSEPTLALLGRIG